MAAGLVSSASAQAPPSAERVRGGMFDASDPAGIARFMEKTGYRVELRSDTKGDPVITGRISRSDYVIQFYECEQGLTCNSIQMMSQTARPATLTPDTANAFNARWRYVRVTYDAAQVKLQMDVNLDAARGNRLVEPLLADEAPRAHHIGHHVDGDGIGFAHR